MMANLGDRTIVLIDMDCFFCQVEAKLQPEYKGKPLAVCQYLSYQLGGIIAVNYEARGFGVTRHMRAEEAREKCPEIILACVPGLRGKADTARYRKAGKEVLDVLKKHCNKIERASVDEAYLDITQIVEDRMAATPTFSSDLQKKLSNTYVVGYSESGENDEEKRKESLEAWLDSSFGELDDISAQKLAVAGIVVEELRSEVYEITGFRCSAGISYNKILAKLACGLHKPNKQTILPISAVPILYKTLPVKKVRNLGGKLGDVVIDSLNCNVMSDLLKYSLQDLQKLFDEKTGMWLYNIARGIDNEPVVARLISKSIGACKNFPGKQAIVNSDALIHWLGELSAEVCERLEQDLEENERRASLLTVSFHYYQDKVMISQSRSCALNSYKPEKVTTLCHNIITKATKHPISFLGLSAGKFIQTKGSGHFRNYFTANINKEENKLDCSDFFQIKDSSVSYCEHENNEKIRLSMNSEELKCENVDNPEKKSEDLFEDHKLTPSSSFDKALHSEHFKQSFFMNILKERQESSKDKFISKEETLSSDLKEGSSAIYDSNNPRMSHPEEPKAVKDHLNNAGNLNSIPKNFLSFNESSNELETLSKHEEILTEEEKGLKLKSSQYLSQVSSSNWSAAKMDNVEPFVNHNGNVTVKLHEIFPDLTDIDPGVISLLPPELQKEASELLKNSIKSNKKTANIQARKFKKSAKLRSVDQGSSKSENSIQNFLIKSTSGCEIDNSLNKCVKCNQLVPVEKMQEHNDYHVAQDVQKEINKSTTQDVITKRKQSFESGVGMIKKRHTKNLKNNSKNKSIATFFL